MKTSAPSPVAAERPPDALPPSQSSPVSALRFPVSSLPGADLIVKGLEDRAANRRTPEACLVEMASPRLAAAGILPEPATNTDSELTLYKILGEENNDPYPLYNSLCRRLVSFEQALDHRLRQNREEAV